MINLTPPNPARQHIGARAGAEPAGQPVPVKARKPSKPAKKGKK